MPHAASQNKNSSEIPKIMTHLANIQANDLQEQIMDIPARHWIYRLLPYCLWPYAQLARWDRPIGWQLLLWPCWWSAALASIAWGLPRITLISITLLLWHLFLFFVGAIAMRGAGCTYNDLVDHHIDKAVERTRSRPLPSEKVTRNQAKAFIILQSFVGLLVLIQFNRFTIILGLASLIIVVIYPFMKRVTDWPQLFLGLAFNWGALLGWTAVFGTLDIQPVLLYLGAIFWTIGYDTIYAHQDREDDAIIGVRSTARLFGKRTKPALFCLYTLMLVFTTAAFILTHVPPIALSGIVFTAIHMLFQIKTLDIDNPNECLWLFKSNSIIGLLIFLMLMLGNLWII
ncbi:MAG: 4-hydroxybenzoate polyprenyltransferase [Candidatus Tokpelaia sp. JSC189]|nr:MAG: 4-hydroxybenzoate polyprenyltransferase [Candidatus Tokpelaia sp. JSC189]